MGEAIFRWFLYFGRLILLTLGVPVLCGLSVRLCSVTFSRLLGKSAERVFDATAVIGTPIHELGHAVMCPLFGHKITQIRLWSPSAQGGSYGFVKHSYSKKNLWAQLGNLFIGIGPIMSGLGVVVLMLRLCFPLAWGDYLTATRDFAMTGGDMTALSGSVMQLLFSVVRGVGEVWWRALLGIAVILSVALHVSLSWADIKGSLGALPVYLFLTAVFALVTNLLSLNEKVIAALSLFNLRVLSLFCVVIALCAVWVALALLFRVCRAVRTWF